MKNKIKEITYSVVLGLCLGAIGVFFMGYVTASAILNEIVLWFADEQLANYIINFISQFIAFGVIAISIGVILGRLSESWLVNCLACYAAFLCYLSVGSAFIYKTDISNPFSGFSYFDLPAILLLPLCLFITSSITAKKLRHV